MYITEHFSLEEMTKSEAAERAGIDNSLPTNLNENMRLTCECMEFIREFLNNKPILINSGYRCERLNQFIGGSRFSAHMNALAVDFICPRYGTPYKIAKDLSEAGVPNLDQLIYEHSWVHVGFALTHPRRQLLTQRLGRFDLGIIA